MICHLPHPLCLRWRRGLDETTALFHCYIYVFIPGTLSDVNRVSFAIHDGLMTLAHLEVICNAFLIPPPVRTFYKGLAGLDRPQACARADSHRIQFITSKVSFGPWIEAISLCEKNGSGGSTSSGHVINSDESLMREHNTEPSDWSWLTFLSTYVGSSSYVHANHKWRKFLANPAPLFCDLTVLDFLPFRAIIHTSLLGPLFCPKLLSQLSTRQTHLQMPWRLTAFCQ